MAEDAAAPASEAPPRKTGVAGAATLVGILTAASLVLGFGRDIVIAAVFGASAELDAYFVAQGLMNLVLGLAAGATAKAVIPVVAPAAAAGDAASAHRSVASALVVATVVLGIAAVVMGIYSANVVAVLAPGFGPSTSALAQELTRLVLVATVLIAGTNVLAAVAQSHRRFFWASAQGVGFNLVMIAAAGLFGPRYGVAALAIGFVVGSGARLLMQLVPLHQIGARLVPTLDPADPGLRTIARLVPPLLVGSAAANVNTLVDRAVASIHGEGTITALSYGWRIASLADTLLVASLVAALYPAFGAASALNARPELRRLVARGLGAIALVLVPVVALLIVGATPIVALLFGHGSFGPTAVALTATAVAFYALALLPLAGQEVVIRAFYALGDSRTPVAVAVLAMAVNAVGDLTLGVILGVPGIAIATVVSLSVGALLNATLLARRHAAIEIGTVGRALGRLGLCGVLAAGAAAIALNIADSVTGATALSSGWEAAWQAGSAAVALVAAYAAALLVLRVPEASMARQALGLTWSWLRRRLPGRSR